MTEISNSYASLMAGGSKMELGLEVPWFEPLKCHGFGLVFVFGSLLVFFFPLVGLLFLCQQWNSFKEIEIYCQDFVKEETR